MGAFDMTAVIVLGKQKSHGAGKVHRNGLKLNEATKRTRRRSEERHCLTACASTGRER
jgi:hypothetical protein